MPKPKRIYSCPACGADIEAKPDSMIRLRCPSCEWSWSGAVLEDEPDTKSLHIKKSENTCHIQTAYDV